MPEVFHFQAILAKNLEVFCWMTNLKFLTWVSVWCFLETSPADYKNWATKLLNLPSFQELWNCIIEIVLIQAYMWKKHKLLKGMMDRARNMTIWQAQYSQIRKWRWYSLWPTICLSCHVHTIQVQFWSSLRFRRIYLSSNAQLLVKILHMHKRWIDQEFPNLSFA